MLYLTEGDYINAGLSALSIIPGADAFTKTGKASKVLGNGIVESGLKHLDNVADGIKKLVKKADDAIDLEKHLPKKLLTEEAEAFAKKADKVADDVVEDAAKAIKGGRETELFLPDEYYQKLDDNIAKAIAARDAEVAKIQGLSKTQQSNIATVVAGVDIRTGEVYVGVKNSRNYKGNATCEEDIVFRGLGGNTNANIIMISAIRPRNNEVIPVCTRCQTKYPQNQFMKGTTFE